LNKDIAILRELAKRIKEESSRDIQNERRSLWRDFNSLKTKRVPVYIMQTHEVWHEVIGDERLECEDELFRFYEKVMRCRLYHASLGDDFITEPWITVFPEYTDDEPNWQTWGLSFDTEKISKTMAFHITDPPIKTMEDISKIVTAPGVVDIKKTEAKLNKLKNAVGDIIDVIPDYFPPMARAGKLSFLLGRLFGPEELMYHMYDSPEVVHEVCRLVSSASMKYFEEMEARGWLTNNNMTFLPQGNAQIQAQTYCHELPEPGPFKPVTMKEHWFYDHVQEFESMSPEMFEEFILQYQTPLYERFGLLSFGCCENLTLKFKYLKNVKNLRRVAVTPWADNEECAKQIEDRYVISWRPNPVDMVSFDFDSARIKRIINDAKAVFERYGCHWEINLKDFITVGGDKDRLRKWVDVARSVVDC